MSYYSRYIQKDPSSIYHPEYWRTVPAKLGDISSAIHHSNAINRRKYIKSRYGFRPPHRFSRRPRTRTKLRKNIKFLSAEDVKFMNMNENPFADEHMDLKHNYGAVPDDNQRPVLPIVLSGTNYFAGSTATGFYVMLAYPNASDEVIARIYYKAGGLGTATNHTDITCRENTFFNYLNNNGQYRVTAAGIRIIPYSADDDTAGIIYPALSPATGMTSAVPAYTTYQAAVGDWTTSGVNYPVRDGCMLRMPYQPKIGFQDFEANNWQSDGNNPGHMFFPACGVDGLAATSYVNIEVVMYLEVVTQTNIVPFSLPDPVKSRNWDIICEAVSAHNEWHHRGHSFKADIYNALAKGVRFGRWILKLGSAAHQVGRLLGFMDKRFMGF